MKPSVHILHNKMRVSEGKHHHLLEVTRCLMLHMLVPKNHRLEALFTTCYLINWMSSSTLNNEIPYSVLHPNRFYSLLDLECLGAFVMLICSQEDMTKLSVKSVKSAFLWYSTTQKGYWCYNPTLRKMLVIIDVIFFEKQAFYLKDSHKAPHNVFFPGLLPIPVFDQ